MSLIHFYRGKARLLGLAVFFFLKIFGPHYFATAASNLGPEELDRIIAEIRTEVFLESPGQPGVPGLDISRIDRTFVQNFYERPGVLDAIQRIFSTDAYKDINRRVGEIRNELNLECWAEIADKYNIPVELNNAGKNNGAISDLDNTGYTSATRLWDPDGNQWIEGSDAIHKFIIQKHTEVWKSKMGGLTPLNFDCMHFSGSGMMQDWRMSKYDLMTFVSRLDADIARLSATEGAYWVPGAYKQQVYQRYLKEGRTYRLEPTKAGQSLDGVNRIILKNAPKSVIIHAEAPTAQVSDLYKDVPGEIDKYGALEDVGHNDYFANQYRGIPLKNEKYNTRSNNGGNPLVNLEVNFRELLLQGKTVACEQMVETLFGEYLQQEAIHPELRDVNEATRVIEYINRIELDKIIRSLGSDRPDTWSDYWQKYKPRDINDPKVKADYFSKEIADIRRTMPDIATGRTDLQLVDIAEGLFVDKARSINRVSAVIAARRVFNDLFTREGYAREVYLHGETKAQKQIAERLRGTHALLAYQVDEGLIKAIAEAAPADAGNTIRQLAELARSQRNAILERKAITVAELQAGNPILHNLISRLKTDNSLLTQPDSIADEVALEARREHIRWQLAGRQRGTYAGITSDSILRSAAFMDHQLGLAVNLGFLDTKERIHQALTFQDIGTIDNLSKVYTAWAKGDTAKAEQEARDMVLGTIFDKFYDVPKNLADLINKGKAAPMATYLGVKAGDWLGEKMTLGPVAGYLLALYSMEKNLGEFGWHFYGEPTEREVVSWVLMGHPSAALDPPVNRPKPVGIVQSLGQAIIPDKESQFPALPSSAIYRLQENALLEKRIPIPEGMTEDLIKVFVKSSFFARANQRTQKGGFDMGSYDFWVERDRILDGYLEHADYWIRRAHLYANTHTDFFRYAQHRNPNWQGYSKDPPGAIADRPLAEIKAEFSDAYKPLNPGDPPRWNYELVYLRLFFQDWLHEWKKTQPENGHFITTANNLTLDWSDIYISFSDLYLDIWIWEKAVVDELINTYKEGELWDIDPLPVTAQRNREKTEARDGAARKAMELALQELTTKLSDDLRRQLKLYGYMEQILWDPKVTVAIAEDVISALSKQQPYVPNSPRVSYKIHRPVANIGGELPMNIQVFGDVKLLAEDLEPNVEYHFVKTHLGRPVQVLEDDVKILLGDLPDDRLIAHECEARLTASSPVNPSFVIDVGTETVYFIEAKPEKPRSSNIPGENVILDDQDVILGQVEIDDPRIGFDVASLIGLPLREAMAILHEIRLVGKPVLGSPATGNNQYGHVEFAEAERLPLQPGSVIRLTIFSENITTIEVPFLIGTHILDASRLTEAAGLKFSAKLYGPAPLPDKAGVVVDQEPFHQSQVKPGSQVSVQVYGEYEKPPQPLRDVPPPTVTLRETRQVNPPKTTETPQTNPEPRLNPPAPPAMVVVPEVRYPARLTGIPLTEVNGAIPTAETQTVLKRPKGGFSVSDGLTSAYRFIVLEYGNWRDRKNNVSIIITWMESQDSNLYEGIKKINFCEKQGFTFDEAKKPHVMIYPAIYGNNKKIKVHARVDPRFYKENEQTLRNLLYDIVKQIEPYAMPCH